MSLYAEVAYSRYRPIDRDAIVPRIRQDLKDMGMLAGDAEICVDDVNDIQYGYPIYDAHYNQARPNIIKYFNQKRIYPCGRYGSWRYMSMEDAILDGKRVAECLIANA
jgi:protoporphyrinogen oxidase